MKFRKILTTMTALSMGVVMVGCGSNTSNAGNNPGGTTAPVADGETQAVTLTVWSPAEDQADDQGKWLQTMCDKFNELHPEWDITFKYGTCSEGDIGTTVSQDPANSADVYIFANDQIGALLDAQAIARLGGEAVTEVQNNNDKIVVDSVTVDGAVYGIPLTTNTWFMYYNKEVFNDEDIKSLDKMLEKGKVAFPMTTAWYNGSFFLGNGGTMFGDGTDAAAGIDFGGDKGLEVMNYLVDLVNNPNFVNDADGAGISNLRSGAVGAYFSGSWDYASVKEILGDNFGAAQLPTFTVGGKEAQLKSFAGSKAIGVNPNCKDPQVAVALARYLGGADAQRAHYELRSVIPCNTELLADQTIAADPLIKAQNDTINNTSIIQPTLSQMATYFEAAETFGKALVNKEITHDNAKEKLDSYVNQLNSL